MQGFKSDIENTRKCINSDLKERIRKIVKTIELEESRRIIIFGPHYGFGHALTAPHVSKYLFGDDKTILIFFATEDRHNQKLGSSYPETKIFYISAGKPGWNISLSSYVILPAITINYIRNVSKKEIDILLKICRTC